MKKNLKLRKPITLEITAKGEIVITQDFGFGEEESTIYLGWEEANILVQWLQEAMAELEKQGKK